MKRVSSLPVFFLSFFLAPCSILVACPLPVSKSTEEDGQQYKWGPHLNNEKILSWKKNLKNKNKIKIICHLLPTSI
jgi:hypothetical protein